MRAKVLTIVTVAAACMVSWSSLSLAAEPESAKSPNTTISVQGMHCAGCAKKVETKLKAITGVDAVKIDVPSGKVVVQPKEKKQLSPRSLWETVEKSGYQPTKLVGPTGEFTEKPKS